MVIASFNQGSLVSQVHDGAQGYYNTVTRVIMASGNDATPSPINGGWCPVTCPSGAGPTTIYQSCECPAPAFGGKYCPGTGTVACGGGGTVLCGPCPTGQDCNAQGVCVCSNGLDCSSIPNASPDPSCTKCNCNNYTYWDPTNKSCDYCTSQGGLCYTSTDGVSCTVVTCPTYAYCDTSTNQCVYCPEGQMYNGSSCVPIVCPPNMYFDTNPSDPGYNTCACIAGYEYTTGPGCVPCPGGVCGPCTPSPSCNGFNCGKDSCGNSCGICPGPRHAAALPVRGCAPAQPPAVRSQPPAEALLVLIIAATCARARSITARLRETPAPPRATWLLYRRYAFAGSVSPIMNAATHQAMTPVTMPAWPRQVPARKAIRRPITVMLLSSARQDAEAVRLTLNAEAP